MQSTQSGEGASGAQGSKEDDFVFGADPTDRDPQAALEFYRAGVIDADTLEACRREAGIGLVAPEPEPPALPPRTAWSWVPRP